MSEIADLIGAAADGKRAALARLLTKAERGGPDVFEIERHIQSLVGQAWTVGITGPPGAGKSTLINALLPVAQESLQKAAVLAVDPSSPFSKGAILGDRVRMQGSQFGESVFIRSMASRGEVGGLARATSTCIRLFDAARWPIILIETLGIGQVELDIMDLADTVIVVLNPGWGDTFQANKAGLTEAGDIFVINKADRPGTAETKRDLVSSLALMEKRPTPAIIETVATEAKGVENLWTAIEEHRARLREDNAIDHLRQARRAKIVRRMIKEQINQKLDGVLESDEFHSLVEGASIGEIEVGGVVDQVLSMLREADDLRKHSA